jgi:hypothetical protein
MNKNKNFSINNKKNNSINLNFNFKFRKYLNFTKNLIFKKTKNLRLNLIMIKSIHILEKKNICLTKWKRLDKNIKSLKVYILKSFT